MTTLKVLQLTDLHVLPNAGDKMLAIDTEQYFQKTLAHAHMAHGPFDLILLTGDLAQDPCLAAYRRICQYLQSYQTPCLCLPGNHDDSEMMEAALNADLVSCKKHLLIGNWQIIALSSQKQGSAIGHVSQCELDYLENMLTANVNPALVAIHHHCVPSRSSWMDTMQIENSADLLAIAERHSHLKAITCGHLHQELQTVYKHVAIYATPASCFQFRPFSSEFEIEPLPPGYRVFELADNGNLQSNCYRLSLDMSQLQTNIHSY